MKRLRKDAEKAPVVNIVIAMLLVVGFASFPVRETMRMLSVEYTQTNKYIFTAAMRAAFCGVAVYLMYAYQFKRVLTWKARRLYLVLPCLLVVANNFPIVALASGAAQITADGGTIALYLVQTFFIAAFEELAFRGVVFPLCWLKLKKRKYSVLWSAALSSALFGAVHLVNLVGGAGFVPVLLQIGYSFLLGGMCAVALAVTGSMLVPILLHFIFNAGGLLVGELGSGSIVNFPTVFITVVLAVAVFTLMLYLALKTKNERMEELFGAREDETAPKQEV
ncbi:MAG: hypothetical protein DBX59_10840 [Bacillota bacterium]|nr:MAG: hypothetical protein DBX59_10840 [Bacillota bacterium]